MCKGVAGTLQFAPDDPLRQRHTHLPGGKKRRRGLDRPTALAARDTAPMPAQSWRSRCSALVSRGSKLSGGTSLSSKAATTS